MMLDFNYEYNDLGKSNTLILLHGFLSDMQTMKDISSEFNNMNTLLIDLPGFGQTKSVGIDYSMDDISKGIVKIVDELNLTNVHVYGYSMGGRVAISLLANYSERFNKFILESTSPGMSKAFRRDSRIEIDESRATDLETDFESFINDWEELPLFKTQKLLDEKTFLLQRKERLSQNGAEAADSLRKYGTGIQPHYWDNLNKNNDVLIIVGEKDEKFVKIGDNMNKQLKNSCFKIIKKCGHNVHLENKEAFIKECQEFLSEGK